MIVAPTGPLSPVYLAAWLEGEFLTIVKNWTKAKRVVAAARARVDAGEDLPPRVLAAYVNLRDGIRQHQDAMSAALKHAANLIDAMRNNGYPAQAEDFRRKLATARGIPEQGIGAVPVLAIALAGVVLVLAIAVYRGVPEIIRAWSTETTIVEDHLNKTTTTTTTPTGAVQATSAAFSLLPLALLAAAAFFLFKRR